jgi:uncharacterized protein YcbK (DUF882 family)
MWNTPATAPMCPGRWMRSRDCCGIIAPANAMPSIRSLMDYLYDVAALEGVDPAFSVISGYRSPQTNERLRESGHGVAQRSLHMEGRAIDVRLAGVDCADLSARALHLQARRCGLLP